MVYTCVYSSPLLCRLLPFFSRGYVPIPRWFHPECLHCVLWGTYTECAGVLTLCALGCLHCVLWGDGDYAANG